jgi:uncharacterized protein
MTKGITFFEISGPDADGLRRFYAEGIGLELADPIDGYTMLPAGDDDAIDGGLFDGSAGPGTYAMPYVWVDDVDAAVEQAVAAGATLLVAPFPHGPTRAAHVADPAGNRIGLFQPA